MGCPAASVASWPPRSRGKRASNKAQPAHANFSTQMAAEQTIHLERYVPEAKALVASAQGLADERKHAQVEPVHLLYRAVERDRGIAEVFRRAGADPADVTVEAESALGRIPKATS